MPSPLHVVRAAIMALVAVVGALVILYAWRRGGGPRGAGAPALGPAARGGAPGTARARRRPPGAAVDHRQPPVARGGDRERRGRGAPGGDRPAEYARRRPAGRHARRGRR